jgi:hypothetical protein
LFDSVNGSASSGQPGKELRGLVTETSDHLTVWRDSLPVLQSMFYSSDKGKLITPSIKNWAHNIRVCIYLRSKLFSLGFKRFAMRNFNQDPIENFFSCIRSHGMRNTNPNCSAFITTFKSLLVNNLVSRRSIGANCEEDESAGILCNLRAFLTEQGSVEFISPAVQPPVFPATSASSSTSATSTFVADYTNAYVSGYVAKKILSKSKCSGCMKTMCATTDLPENILIREREFKGYKLAHPSSAFSIIFRQCTNLILSNIPTLITGYNIKHKLQRTLADGNCNINTLFCSKHNATNVDTFIRTTVNIILHNYINNINKVLKGKDFRHANSGDYVRSLAFTKSAKRFWRRRK